MVRDTNERYRTLKPAASKTSRKRTAAAESLFRRGWRLPWGSCFSFAILLTSAVTGEGIEDLRRALYEAALRGASPEEAYLTNERHVQAAKDALAALESAVTALEDRTLDCAALDLRAAWEALGAITGESATEDVIDRIFEKFCLGK